MYGQPAVALWVMYKMNVIGFVVNIDMYISQVPFITSLHTSELSLTSALWFWADYFSGKTLMCSSREQEKE